MIRPAIPAAATRTLDVDTLHRFATRHDVTVSEFEGMYSAVVLVEGHPVRLVAVDPDHRYLGQGAAA